MQAQVVPLTEQHRPWVHQVMGVDIANPSVFLYGEPHPLNEVEGYVGFIDGKAVAFALYKIKETTLDIIILFVPSGFSAMLGWLANSLERSAKKASCQRLRTVVANAHPGLLSAFRQNGFMVAAYYPAISEKYAGETRRELYDLEKVLVYRVRS